LIGNGTSFPRLSSVLPSVPGAVSQAKRKLV
jgi:hypothetical protein